MEDASPRDRAAVVVESLSAMDSSEIAETVINISGYKVRVHYTVYMAYSVQCTVYMVYSVQCTLYIVQCTEHSVQCTVYGLQYTGHISSEIRMVDSIAKNRNALI